jgi:NodT family efflux transporter outer membrane factor (OMF) lipoprotein
MRRTLCGLLTALALTGCTVGPDYRRPPLNIPNTYRGPSPAAIVQQRAFADLEWWKLFQDEQLQALIDTALEQNYDLRIAATRILQARAQVTIARSFQFPTADAVAAAPLDQLAGGNRPPSGAAGPAIALDQTFLPQGGLSLAWELDLWGRFRRATEAARAELLASEDFRAAVVLTLISDVARAYFELRELDLELEISRQTLASRAEYVRLTKAREEGGVATLMDVRQAEQLYYGAAAIISDLQGRIQLQENLISVLIGMNPETIRRGRPLTEQALAPSLPPGLTSELLRRRPDILLAEQQLVAANARIGEAKALLFPAVVISGFAGVGGAVINGSAFGPFGAFQALPTVTLPVFNAGRLRANVDFNDATTQEAVLRYQQVILQAFREVSDGLFDYRRQQGVRAETEATVQTQRDALRLANLRYEGGVTSFLEVLITERDLFDFELALARVQRDELLAVVRLYRALGGGWQSELPPPPSAAIPESHGHSESRPARAEGTEPAPATPAARTAPVSKSAR